MTCTVPGCGAPARLYVLGRRCPTHAPQPAPPTPPPGTTADELRAAAKSTTYTDAIAVERARRSRIRHEGRLP